MTSGRGDIAIIGMACVFPGAASLQAYWENILRKVNAVGDPPPDWEAELFLDTESGAEDRLYCARGGYLGPLADFDPTKFGIVPNSIDGTEPDHFLALRTAYEAMADAGYATREMDRSRIEVIVGRGTYVNRGNATVVQHALAVDSVLRVLKQLHPEHSDEELAAIRRQLKSSLPPFHAETAAGLVPNIITGRVANRLDFMGANYLVDAACASSLVAIDHGMRDLQAGRCDLALVGGVHASTPPPIVMIFCQLKAISKRGEIRPFDSRADGTLLGEGVGMIALKRREDAERDNDHIYAIVKGLGISSDGRALGLLAPRLEGEQLALQRAYEAAAVDPSTVELVEAHGTATPVGDVVEIEALSSVFGERSGEFPSCALGSVKSMISHLMPASGVAGVIKTALALHHRVLPATINCEEPNPKLGLDTSRFYLNSDTRPWIHGSAEMPRRAGVNAFGFGGINAHAVLEEYTGPAPRPPMLQHQWDSETLVISADTRAELLAEIERVRHAVSRPAVNLKDLAYTVTAASDLEPVRLAIVATSLDDCAAKLDRAAARLRDDRCQRIRDIEGIYFFAAPLAPQGKVAFVFPGEGSQYPNMLADICVHFPEVRGVFDVMDRAFLDHPRGYLPSQVIFPPPTPTTGGAGDARIYRMDSGAEAVFAANQALGRLLAVLGVQADAMVGHSTGEHSALLVSGAVKPADDAELIAHIRRVNSVFEKLNAAGDIPQGFLVAVGGVAPATLREIAATSGGRVHIAMDNCPHQTVLCTNRDYVDTLTRDLQATGAILQTLPFARAYHTPWFEVFCEPMRDYFKSVNFEPTAARLYSCVSADAYPDDIDAKRELVATQWARCVRFRETVEAMYRDGVRIFVEAGPRSNLCGFIDDVLRGRPYIALPSNVQHRSGITQLNHLAAQLAAHHVPMRLGALYERRSPQRIQLNVAAEIEKPAIRRAMKLSTGLQPLRLPTDFALPAKPRRVEVRETSAPPASIAAAPASPPPAAATVNLRAEIVQRHLQTMDQFLATQSTVLQTYLNARQAPRTVVVELPFMQTVTERIEGQKATAVRSIDLDEDRLFQQHTLGREVSAVDPSLLALPVVPFTVTMEMLAEAAALVKPGRVVVGMTNVRASRWITLERASTELEFSAVAAGPDAVGVTARERRSDAKLSPVIAEATVHFADAYSPCRAPAFGLRHQRSSTWRSEQLYREGMFHGPSFQGVKSVERYGEDGNVCRLEALARTGLLRSNPNPRFLIDPVLLDAAGQALAFWVKERFGILVDVFPYGVEAVHAYGPPPEPGTTFECRVKAELVGSAQTRCDIDIVDAAGNVLYAIKGWLDRRFELPEPFVRLRISPAETTLSAQWDAPAAALPAAHGVVCQRLSCMSEDLLQAHGGIWLKVLAHLVLSRRERAEFDRMTAVPKRRQEWLLGRTVAKDAVRRLLQRQVGLRLAPADIEIVRDRHGRPEVTGAWLDALEAAPNVSISHSCGTAVAVASLASSSVVGLDIESMTRSGEFAKTAFTTAEQQLLASFEPASQVEWALRLWCAKESVGKALGRGLAGGPHALVVKTAAADSGAVGVTVGGTLLEEFPKLTGRELRTFTTRDGDIVASMAVLSLN